MFLSKIFTFCDFKRQKPDWLFKKAHSPALTATDGTLSPLVWTGPPASRPTVWERTTNHWKNCPICPAHVIISQWGYQQTCGGVGVEVVLPPDIISSVMSRPPWLGSRILICEETTGKSQASGSKQKTHQMLFPPTCLRSLGLTGADCCGGACCGGGAGCCWAGFIMTGVAGTDVGYCCVAG